MCVLMAPMPFCAEGVHIAEASGAACAVLSPCLPTPRRMPAGFEEEFASAMPTLHRRLVQEQQRQHTEQRANQWDDPRVLVDRDARCSWDDVSSWMWRLFLEDHGQWREEALGLAASPLDAWDDPACTEPLPPRPVLLVGLSPSLAALVLQVSDRADARAIPRDAHAADRARTVSTNDPNAPDIAADLGAVGSGGLAVGDHRHVGICCGPWLEPPNPQRHAHMLPLSLRAFLSRSKESCRDVVGVGFGSMPGLGFIDFARADADGEGAGLVLLRLLLRALHEEELSAVWLLKDWPEHVRADLRLHAQRLGRRHEEDYITGDAVSHEALLPRCIALVHHGGASTVATCVRIACFQIICPVAFDQPAWARALHGIHRSGGDCAGLQERGTRRGGHPDHQHRNREHHSRALGVWLPFFQHWDSHAQSGGSPASLQGGAGRPDSSENGVAGVCTGGVDGDRCPCAKEVKAAIRAIRQAHARVPLARSAGISEETCGPCAHGEADRTASAGSVEGTDKTKEKSIARQEDCVEGSVRTHDQATNPRAGKRLCLEGGGRGDAATTCLGGEDPSKPESHSQIVEKWKETVEREAREGLVFAASVVQAMHADTRRRAGRDTSQTQLATDRGFGIPSPSSCPPGTTGGPRSPLSSMPPRLEGKGSCTKG